jgi:sialic acid synthase
MATMEISPGRFVGQGHPVYVVAEIGQNHQGSLSTARDMIAAAKAAGADCVKFQKSSLCDKFTASALNASYDSENSWGATYGEHKKYLEFDEEQYRGKTISYMLEVIFKYSAL